MSTSPTGTGPTSPTRSGISRRAVMLLGGAGAAGLALASGHQLSLVPTACAATSQRARFHMTPPRGWLCDCQRPITLGGKTYLYYLHSDQTSGEGGWDVCTTTDLVRFSGNRKAIPLRPKFPVWSGSAVVDTDNTAGFGAGAVVVLATQPTGGVRRDQEQYLYWSRDGVHFSEPGAPVIDNPDGDSARTDEEIDNAEWFRDPKVVWDAERSQWVCVIGRRTYASLYVSTNLKQWRWVSNFDYLDGTVPDLGGIECPDLFQMTADDGTTHWVLGASMDGWGAGQPMTYAYWVGTWDGTAFHTNTNDPQWLDRGWDWYAAVTWPAPEDPERTRYAIGWMNNWKYAAREVPTGSTDSYNGQMSVVRRLRLARQPDGWYTLLSEPVPALDRVLSKHESLPDRSVTDQVLLERSGRAYELDVDIDWSSATNVGVSVGCSKDNSRHVNVGVIDGRVYVDRGPADRAECSFLPYRQAEAPIDPAARHVHLRVLVDTQSVEVFVNAGHTVLSQQVYFRDGDDGIRLYAYDGEATFSNLRWKTLA